MNKVQTKRFAVLALLLSFVLGAAAFALLGVRSTAKAEGEVEMTFGREILSSAWVKNTDYAMSYVDVPVVQLNGDVQTHDIHNQCVDHVKIVRGSQTFAAGNVYSENALRLYFNNTGYYGDAAQNGDKLIIEAGFSVNKMDNTKLVCTDGVSWTFDGTSWKAY